MAEPLNRFRIHAQTRKNLDLGRDAKQRKVRLRLLKGICAELIRAFEPSYTTLSARHPNRHALVY